jgi:hypothetical protein
MNKIKVGHYEADGSLINLPLGFIPDYFMLTAMVTNPLFYHWWRQQQLEEATGAQEGIIDTAGTKTLAADDAGITAYDASSQRPTIEEWSEARSTAATARTATANGTYIKPTTTSPTDRGAIFECVTAGTGASTEPTWPDSIGEQVTDNSTVWERVDKSLERGGYQGVIIEDNIQTDGQEMYYVALQANQSLDHGDVVGWTDGIEWNS